MAFHILLVAHWLVRSCTDTKSPRKKKKREREKLLRGLRKSTAGHLSECVCVCLVGHPVSCVVV